MDAELIEKVARAMHAVYTSEFPWDTELDANRNLWRDLARAAIAAMSATPQDATVIGPEWQPCRKRPVVVHVREQRPGEQHVSTREGITPVKPDDLIMRGVEGEEYPIGRDLFARTYDLVTDEPTTPQAAQVPEAVHRDTCTQEQWDALISGATSHKLAQRAAIWLAHGAAGFRVDGGVAFMRSDWMNRGQWLLISMDGSEEFRALPLAAAQAQSKGNGNG